MPPPPVGPPSVPPVVPPGAPSGAWSSAKGKRPSKKLLIVGAAVVLVLLAAVVALFIVKDVMRGGAKSPEAVGQQLIESVNTKDVVGLVTLIVQHERDAAMRVHSAVSSKFTEYGIAAALKKVAPEGSYGTDNEFVLDGVNVTVSGATPLVSEISADFAQVRFTSGEVRTSIDPAKTKGALRAVFEASGQENVIESSFFIADMGPGQSGLTLISAKTDGRWYLSPMLSALEYGKVFAEQELGPVSRGAVPDTFPKGSDSAEEAAGAAVRNAVVAFNDAEPAALAPSLVKAEAAAFYLYADLWKPDDVSDEPWAVALGDASFTKGATDGNRAHAIVQNLSVEADGEKVSITESCIASSSGDKLCLNGSGYALGQSKPTVNPMAFFTVGGNFGLTTVKEDGKWKVSVLDTAADMAIAWVDSLTKEQALALLGLEQTDKPVGALSWEKAATVDYNSAGYAVRTLSVDKTQNVAFETDDPAASVKVYSADLKTEMEQGYKTGSYHFALEPGDYLVVLFAADAWQEKFASEGNKVKHSTPVKVYSVEPQP